MPEIATFMPAVNVVALVTMIVAWPEPSLEVPVITPAVVFPADMGSRQGCEPVPVQPFVQPSVRFQSDATMTNLPIGSTLGVVFWILKLKFVPVLYTDPKR